MVGLHDATEEVNVWPAVTDTMLLMASIFLVFSIIATVVYVGQYRTRPKPGGGDQLLVLTFGIPEKRMFASGQFKLSNEAQALKTIQHILTFVPQRLPKLRETAASKFGQDYFIVMEAAGHTDNVPYPTIEGKDGNWELSNQRANAVIDLMEKCLKQHPDLRRTLGVEDGVAHPGSTVLRAAGYSSHLPVQPYSTSTVSMDRELNRRVEVRLYAEPSWVLRNPPRAPSP